MMIGAALLLPAIQHENTFYRNLTWCIFWIATFIHNALNWQAVVRHYYLALVATIGPILFMLPYSEVSLYSVLDRFPTLIMTMSLFIEEYSRHDMPRENQWERAPSPRRAPLDGLEFGRRSVVLISGQREELLVHMKGGEGEQYHPPSQASSDISLSAVSGRLPSSCDTKVRNFWPELEQEHDSRMKNEEENQIVESI